MAAEPDTTREASSCQAALEAALPVGTNISVNEDGLYGWRGTVNMYENPTIGLLTAKMAAFIIGIVLAICLVIGISTCHTVRSFVMMASICLGVCAFVAALTGVFYLIYRALLGGTYAADYLMDDTGLVFKPAPKADRISKNVAIGTAIIAALAGSYGVTAAGIAATNTEGATRFKSAHRIKGIKKHCVIKVSEWFLYNQVYVAPQDYDFVYNFIRERCPKAKCIER